MVFAFRRIWEICSWEEIFCYFFNGKFWQTITGVAGEEAILDGLAEDCLDGG